MNQEPEAVSEPSLYERLAVMVERWTDHHAQASETLFKLETGVLAAAADWPDELDYLNARFADERIRIDDHLNDLPSQENRDQVRAFLTVYVFALLNRLTWLVAGTRPHASNPEE